MSIQVVSKLHYAPIAKTFFVHTVITVTAEEVQDLLLCALEGGSNYWYRIEGTDLPDGRSFREFCDGNVHGYHKVPLEPDCAVLFSDKEDGGDAEIYRLDLDAIHRGVQQMAGKYPRHFRDVLDDNADADTGDCFLQCALFGEMIYG